MTSTPDTAPPSRPAGLKDVAALAGVSHQTVSRVLNDRPRVRVETRQRVLDAIRTLGYRPNLAARALASHRSGVIGVLTASSLFHGQASMVLAVQAAARRAGYYVNVASMEQPDPTEVVSILDHFRTQPVEGVIVVTPDDFTVGRAAELAASVPVVLIAAETPAIPGMAAVNVDQYAGATLAVEHLVAAGHRRIAHLSGPLDRFDAQARRRAWEDVLAAAGLPADALYEGDWTAAGGYAAGRALVRDGPPGAVFAANDVSALGVIRALAEAGLAVPGDVSVVGFDDLPESAFYAPPLTTVHQDFRAVGVQAVDALRTMIDGRTVAVPAITIAPALVARGSVADVPG
ncbi:LacI family DNA-binding transcriptional regulator [Nakamurella deserti]|uniref:LacI family DNA-binding transcriptional regulator n=1 Tax=Nakamurella deserti TaxID=2164074 RepID=UPI000DBE0AB4|nr:LacI family DNA-binding transcriptional regulator [Nakamurella deserti]